MATPVSVAARASAWLFRPVAAGRVAWLRTFLYLFVVADLFVLRPWVADNGAIPPDLYQPLFVGRALPFPTPTELVVAVVRYALAASALVAASGRLVRSAGVVVFVLYFQWMLVAFSYGKVDHDRVAFLVALAVLPTVGRARWGDRTPTEAAGWAVRCVQVAVVATYFLSAFAKFRYGGVDWATGATLMRAVLRRGTWLAEPLEDLPAVLGAAQWGLLAFELATPLMLTGGRVARAFLVTALAFHVVTYAAIEILFWPHVMCLLAFAPLERIPVPAWLDRVAPARASPAST
ncbi:MAG TPA: HTTM domain-containing protein [Actinomycetota bacterium]|nr:HTTM domain-containing protein [Actinomycetota bacterium]